MATSVLEAAPKEEDTHSGIDQDDLRELAGRLEEVLADTYLLYVKTQGFHWNVVGPLFYGLHKLTEQQYQDFAEAIDAMAERIRAIGFPSPGSFAEFSKKSTIEEETGTPSAEEMIQQLVDDNESCSRRLHKAVTKAEEIGDVKTADLLTDRIGRHDENAWMLRSLLN